MWECDYAKEPVDYRLLFLRLLKKIWILPLAALLGAIVIGGGYYFGKMVIGNGRTYQAETMYYIDFAQDDSGSEYEYLNQYTWGQVIYNDSIMDRVEALLGGAMSREEIVASTVATIESDVRYLYTRCVTASPELSLKLAGAVETAVVEFAQTQKEFQSISVVNKAKEAPDNSNIRTCNATVLGGVIGLFAAILAWLIMAVTDTSVYLPSTLERRYHIPSLGAPSMKEFEENCKHFLGSEKKVFLVPGDDEYHPEEPLVKMDGTEFVMGENPVEHPEAIEEYKSAAVVLYVKAGAKNGKRVERTIDQLARCQVRVVAIMLANEDARLIRAYYRK